MKKIGKLALIALAILYWPITLPVWLFLKLKRLDTFFITSNTESYVSRKLHSLNRAEYTILDNLLLPSLGKTNSTQIDHVVVSNYGIFCIETKAHKGWIFGSTSQKYWTQVIYKHRYRFYNPGWQNYAHVKALELALGLKVKVPIRSLVVFPNAGRIRVHGTDSVGDIGKILRIITNEHISIYTDFEKNFIVDRLLSLNATDARLRDIHKSQVHNITANQPHVLR